MRERKWSVEFTGKVLLCIIMMLLGIMFANERFMQQERIYRMQNILKLALEEVDLLEMECQKNIISSICRKIVVFDLILRLVDTIRQ